MRRTVTITLAIEDDHAEAPSNVIMKAEFDPPLRENEVCISAGLVNDFVRAFQGTEMKVQ